MLVLAGIIICLAIVLIAGTWLAGRFAKKTAADPEQMPEPIPLDCCGAHEDCELEEMLAKPDEIIYFDDEELDRFQGMKDDQYDDTQIEEFREIIYSLQYEEIRKWLLSIERRHIQLPNGLRQEVMSLLAVNRQEKTSPDA